MIWIQNYYFLFSEGKDPFQRVVSSSDCFQANGGGKIISNYDYLNRTKVSSEITEIHLKGKGIFLDRNEQWHDFPTIPVAFGPWGARWFVIHKQDGSFFSCLDTNKIDVLEYYTQDDLCIIKIYWLDAISHPQVYFEPGVGEEQRSWEYRKGNYSYELFWVDRNLTDLEIPSFFPEPYQAAFVLTDHADFITPETYLPIFYGDAERPGILSLGLSATVSIFSLSNEENKTDGLNQSEYREMVDRLFKNGIEIAAHSISACTGEQRTLEWFDINVRCLQPYSPVTWIDHGSHICRPDNIISRGWDIFSPHYRLDKIKALGYTNLWSGIDIAVDPVENVGLLSQESITVKKMCRNIRTALKNRKVLVAIREVFRILMISSNAETKHWLFMCASKYSHIFRGISPIKSFFLMLLYLLRAITLLALQSKLSKIWRSPTSPSTPAHCNVVFFESSWYPGMVCFNTIRFNDLHDMLSCDVLERLYSNHDIFIGHVYLSDKSNQHPQKAFEFSDSGIRIDSKFSQGLRRLAKYSEEGKIWVTTLEQLANCWREWRSSSLAIDSAGKLVRSKTTYNGIIMA